MAALLRLATLADELRKNRQGHKAGTTGGGAHLCSVIAAPGM